MSDLPPLREVIARYGLGAAKSLGQHFLLDLNLTDKIVRAAGDLSGRTVIEVGPGPGGLTRALLKAGADRVIAIERDRRFLPALADLAAAYPGRLTVVEGDALAADESSMAGPGPVKAVANLPYNVATALIVKWLTVREWPPWYESLTLMFQKEVAARLTAQPRSKAYGRLSILAQWRCDVATAFDIPARAFTPPPKVDSTVVRLVPKAVAIPSLGPALERVTEAAFGQRRKMLRASLKTLTGDAETLLSAAGLDATKRAEELSVGDFLRLAASYQSLSGSPGARAS